MASLADETPVQGSGGKVRRPRAPFDMRFADREDRDDILSVVNAAFAADCEGPAAFRRNARLDGEALALELGESSTTRWIVLDDQTPEENLVAAVAVLVYGHAGTTRVGQLLALAAKPEVQHSGAGSYLLQRCESVCRGLGCRTLTIEVAAEREPVHAWLQRRGWKESGGGLWSDDARFSRPTPHLILSKDLTALAPADDATAGSGLLLPVPNSGAPTRASDGPALLAAATATTVGGDAPLQPPSAAPDAPGAEQEKSDAADLAGAMDLARTMADLVASLPPSEGGDASDAVEVTAGVGDGNTLELVGTDDNLEALVGSLISQLHTDEGHAEFVRLTQADDANVLGVHLNPDGTVRRDPIPPPPPPE